MQMTAAEAIAERPLIEFMREDLDKIPKEMIYREAAISQMCFFRDYIAGMFRPADLPSDERERFCKIAGFHRSKSIELPVYHFATENLEVIARDNFYNWNATIISRKPLDIPEYMQIDAANGYLYVEGMESWKRGTYANCPSEFSFCKWSKYEFWAVMWCIKGQQ